MLPALIACAVLAQAPVVERPNPVRSRAWVLTGASAALLAAGGAFLGLGLQHRAHSVTPEELSAAHGVTVGGAALLGAGLSALTLSLLMWLWTPDEPPEAGAPAPVRRSFLVPAAEVELVHLGFLAFSNLVSRETFARVSFDSAVSHFDGRAPWTFDIDFFITNQFGHPYQGALSFTAARTAGQSFWVSCLYAFLGSLTWELFYEVDAPSVNDQITTTLGGIFLGEVLHRGAALLLEVGEGETNLFRRIAAFFVEPMGTLNRWLFNGELDARDLDAHAPHFGFVSVGVNVGSVLRDRATLGVVAANGLQLNVQGQLTYGLPGDPAFIYRRAFSHFDLNVNLSVPGIPLAALFIRGLLLGAQYQGSGRDLRGLFGLFGQYDFAEASLARISSVGFGPGTTLQWRFSENGFLQFTTLFSVLPFASAGTLGLDERLDRDYHIGPGGQAMLELKVIHREAGFVRLVAREWTVLGMYVPPAGFESMTYVTAGFMVKLYGQIAAGLDFVFAARAPRFQDDTYNRSVNGSTTRLTLSYMTDENFGAVSR